MEKASASFVQSTVGGILKDHSRLHPFPLAVATQVGFTGAFWLNWPFWLVGILRKKWQPDDSAAVGIVNPIAIYPRHLYHSGAGSKFNRLGQESITITLTSQGGLDHFPKAIDLS